MPQRGYRSVKRKKRRRSRTVGTAILLFAVFLLIGSIVFFRVRNIEVHGAAEYSSGEIPEASGVKHGENLLFTRGSAVSDRLFDALPYLESVRVTKKLPGTIVITVTERRPVACIFTGGSWWLIDSSCKVLEQTNSGGIQDCIVIEGLAVERPEIGEVLTAGAGDTITGDALGEVLTALTEWGFDDKITNLQAGSLSAISFVYDGRIRVDLGTYIDAERKLGLMNGIVSDLEAGVSGALDLSRGDEGRFVPD